MYYTDRSNITHIALRSFVSIPLRVQQINNHFTHFSQEVLSMEVLKVSSHSTPNSVAGAIAGVIREQHVVEVQAVGAGAANQAIKSIAIARGYLAPIGIDLICIPAFASIEIDGEERTAMKLICEPR